MSTAHVIVIGASAGGVEALQAVVRGLPPDLPAAVLVVLHIPPHGPSVLPQILERAGDLPAARASDGEPLLPGRIYTAASDHHLEVADGRIHLVRGPREQGHRPAIDVLFRSAAVEYGNAVIGVVLSGTRQDGAAGLLEVARRGGRTVVQEPQDALYDAMPRAALAHLDPVVVAPAREIGSAIADMVAEADPVPDDGDAPLRVSGLAQVPGEDEDHRIGDPSAFACPDCSGVLWEIEDAGMLRFRCRVGHAWAAEGLLGEQATAAENGLWAALRVLEERAELCRRLADRARERGHVLSAEGFTRRAVQAGDGAAAVRRLVADGRVLPSPGDPADQRAEGAAPA